jgi:hypothetical protein
VKGSLIEAEKLISGGLCEIDRNIFQYWKITANSNTGNLKLQLEACFKWSSIPEANEIIDTLRLKFFFIESAVYANLTRTDVQLALQVAREFS